MTRFYVRENRWLGRILELCQSAGLCALDIETCAKDGWKNDPEGGLDPYRSRIRLVQLATREHSWIIDLNHVTEIEPLKRILEDPKILKIGQNLKFETSFFLHHHGVYPDPIFDTMLASRMLQPAYDFFWKNGLDAIAARFLNEVLPKDQQKSDWSRAELSAEQIEYAHRDAEILIPLYDVLRAKLIEAGMVRSAKIEFDAVLGMADMELAGLTLDRDVLAKITVEIEERLHQLKLYLATEMPSQQCGLFEQEGVNIDSPPQLIEAFRKKTGITLTNWNRETKREEESSDKYALLKHRAAHPILVDALLDYGSLSQILATYCDKLVPHIHPITGRLHPDYRSIGQWQHRCSLKNPNLNFPRSDRYGSKSPLVNFKSDLNFRQLIKAPDDRLFSIADFANSQLRIIADSSFANEQSLQDEFNGPSPNPYARIAANGLGKRKEDVTKQERYAFKMLTLALIFIAGLERYRQARLAETREEISRSKAGHDIATFFKALPAVKAWHQWGPEQAAERGYVESVFGRKIWIPEPYMNGNKAVNYPICATEVDGSKLALGRLARALRKQKLDARPVLFVYDEIAVETSKADSVAVQTLQCSIMKSSMQEVLKLVPADVDANLGTSWSDKP